MYVDIYIYIHVESLQICIHAYIYTYLYARQTKATESYDKATKALAEWKQMVCAPQWVCQQWVREVCVCVCVCKLCLALHGCDSGKTVRT